MNVKSQIDKINRMQTLLRPHFFDISAFLFLLLLFFCPSPTPDKWHNLNFWLIFGPIMLVLIAPFCQRRRDMIFPELLVISFIALISSIIHGHIPQSNTIFAYFNLYTLLNGAIYVIAFTILFHLIANYTYRPYYLVFPLALITYTTFYITSPFGAESFGPLLTHPSSAAIIAALTIPFVIDSKKLSWIFIPMCLYLIYCSTSYTAMFALIIATMLQMEDMKKRAGIILIAAMLMVSSISEISSNFVIRPEVWGSTLGQIFTSPSTFLFGSGFDQSLMSPLIQSSHGWAHRHNEFLSIWTYLGIPGLICLTIFLLRLIYLAPYFGLILALTLTFQTQWPYVQSLVLITMMSAYLVSESYDESERRVV